MDPMQISSINPIHGPTISSWIMSEWGRLPIHSYFDSVVAKEPLSSCLPITYVAAIGNTPIGTVSILLDDLETRPSLNPWIGCLFVVARWRQKGLGAMLMQFAQFAAAEVHGIQSVYLFTENQEDLYGRLGWQVFDTDTYQSKAITIMHKSLRHAKNE